MHAAARIDASRLPARPCVADPSSASLSETIVVTVLVILGALLWTYVLALFCDMITNANPAHVAFRQRLDGLNQFIQVYGLPTSTAMRLRMYMHEKRSLLLREDARMALPLLSLPLQVEVLSQMRDSWWCDKVPFVKDLEGAARVKLLMAMQPSLFAPAEWAPRQRLYVVARGTVIFGGRLLSRNTWWGDDILLLDARCALPFRARAVTYTDVISLTRETLFGALADFPQVRPSHPRGQRRLSSLTLSRSLSLL